MMLILVLFLAVTIVGDCTELKKLTEIFPSKDGKTVINLTVSASQVSVPLKGFGEGTRFEYTGRLYTYNGIASVPGPVIHVKPGGHLLLRLFNNLGEETYQEKKMNMYSYHGVNTTNVHFHGVHGDPFVDNVFKTAAPGQSLSYELRIPSNHAPGLHWYHTHAHGSAYLLLMGGLFGPLVVDEEDNIKGKPSSLFSLPSVLLVVHLYRLRESKTCSGATMNAVNALIENNISSKERVINSEGVELKMPPNLYLVNGQHKPTVKVVLGESTLLRLMFAAGSCHLNMSLPDVCRFDLVASDGVPLKVTRHLKQGWLYFTTATRHDVAILCKNPRVRFIPVTLIEDGRTTLFQIHVVLSNRNKNRGISFPTRPWMGHADYLSIDRPTIQRDLSFSQLDIPSPKPYYVVGQGTNCSSLVNSTTCYYEHFMGSKGAEPNQYQGFAIPLGSVVEARVFGDPGDRVPHPLHLHVNHFTFMSFLPRKGGWHENLTMEDFGIFPGDVRDTIPILDGVTIIRWQAATYVGEIVYHCHALTHEDLGMMSSYLVYQSEGESLARYQYSNTSAERGSDSNRYIFLPLAFLFFLGALISVAVTWIKTNPPDLYSMRLVRETLTHTVYSFSDKVDEMERVPLSRID